MQGEAEVTTGPVEDPEGRIGNLRGAGVEVDVGRLSRVATGIFVVALAVTAAAFLVVGIHQNSQIDALHHRGVPVVVTVSGCTGLLGGSGSNAAGYACTGSFTLGGRRYSESIPGSSTLYPTGATVPGVAVPGGDPPLMTTVAILATEHTSRTVYVVPAVLLVVLALLVGFLVIRRRRAQAAPPGPAPAG